MNKLLIPRLATIAAVRPLRRQMVICQVANFQTLNVNQMPKESAPRRKAKDESATRSGKKKKDPHAPKRSLSAYMFFANDMRDSVRAENPNATFGGIGKLLGEKWKAMTPADKEPYEAKANADKKRYEDEKAAYVASRQDSD